MLNCGLLDAFGSNLPHFRSALESLPLITVAEADMHHSTAHGVAV
jgi:hypothetical protein